MHGINIKLCWRQYNITSRLQHQVYSAEMQYTVSNIWTVYQLCIASHVRGLFTAAPELCTYLIIHLSNKCFQPKFLSQMEYTLSRVPLFLLALRFTRVGLRARLVTPGDRSINLYYLYGQARDLA
jgi:hypothetical protein